MHLKGKRVDLRGASVAELAQLDHFVVQLAVHAPVVGIRLAHFVVVTLKGVKLAVKLQEHVRELVLRIDRRLDRLAGSGRQVEFGKRPPLPGTGLDGGGELRSGELVERLQGFRGLVGGLAEELKGILVESTVCHELQKRVLDGLAVKRLRGGLRRLDEQHIELLHHLRRGTWLWRLHLAGNAVVRRLSDRAAGRLSVLRLPRGIDTVQEVVHRNVAYVNRLWHTFFSFRCPVYTPCDKRLHTFLKLTVS